MSACDAQGNDVTDNKTQLMAWQGQEKYTRSQEPFCVSTLCVSADA